LNAVTAHKLQVGQVHHAHPHSSLGPVECSRTRRSLRYQKVTMIQVRSMIAQMPGDKKIFMGNHL